MAVYSYVVQHTRTWRYPKAVKIVPISEVRQQLNAILTRLEATGEPYFIPPYSRPKAVLVHYAVLGPWLHRPAARED